MQQYRFLTMSICIAMFGCAQAAQEPGYQRTVAQAEKKLALAIGIEHEVRAGIVTVPLAVYEVENGKTAAPARKLRVEAHLRNTSTPTEMTVVANATDAHDASEASPGELRKNFVAHVTLAAPGRWVLGVRVFDVDTNAQLAMTDGYEIDVLPAAAAD
jgi:hypothetical protein